MSAGQTVKDIEMEWVGVGDVVLAHMEKAKITKVRLAVIDGFLACLVDVVYLDDGEVETLHVRDLVKS